MVTNLAGGEAAPAVDPAALHGTVSGAGVPVLLLHGLFGMGSNLGALARALADRYEVHQIDLPNHGRSAWTGPMDLAYLADCVAAYLRGIGRPAHVVGHSLGGKTAMQLGLTYPELVVSLVVADIAPVSYPSTHDAVFAAIADVSARGPASRGEAAALMRNWIGEEGVIQFLLLSLRRESDGIYRWRFNGPTLKASYEEMRSAPQGEPFPGPALFIYGALSTYVDEAGIVAARGLFPGVEFEELADTGHWLHAEKPNEFNAHVGAFLDRHAAGVAA